MAQAKDSMLSVIGDHPVVAAVAWETRYCLGARASAGPMSRQGFRRCLRPFDGI